MTFALLRFMWPWLSEPAGPARPFAVISGGTRPFAVIPGAPRPFAVIEGTD